VRFRENSLVDYVENIGIAEDGQELSDDDDPGRKSHLSSRCGERWSLMYNKGRSHFQKGCKSISYEEGMA
jgi:hypothetical protein